MAIALDLQHTRRAPLRNLLVLCEILLSHHGSALTRDLMVRARHMNLPGFQSVQPFGGLPTRVRHHEYALKELELAVFRESLCILTPSGERLGLLSKTYNVAPGRTGRVEEDVILPAPIQAEFRQVICSSRYVRHWWLRYFMPSDEFNLGQFISEAQDVVIELVPPEYRIEVSTKTGKESADSGFRVHSYFADRATLLLDAARRREIYEGLREWSISTDLVSEVTGWNSVFDIEEEFARKIEVRGSRLDRVYIVRERWGPEVPIDKFEALLSSIRVEMGNVRRIHIPELITILALQEHFSLRSIHDLLHRLYTERHSNYFFEATSRRILEQRGRGMSLNNYVQINGSWRTSIVFSE